MTQVKVLLFCWWCIFENLLSFQREQGNCFQINSTKNRKTQVPTIFVYASLPPFMLLPNTSLQYNASIPTIASKYECKSSCWLTLINYLSFGPLKTEVCVIILLTIHIRPAPLWLSKWSFLSTLAHSWTCLSLLEQSLAVPRSTGDECFSR